MARVTGVRLSSPGVTAYADGDPIGALPLRVVLVPRHPERSPSICEQVAQLGHRPVRWTVGCATAQRQIHSGSHSNA